MRAGDIGIGSTGVTTRPDVARTVQGPALDLGPPLGINVDRAAESAAARSNASLRAGAQSGVTPLSAVRRLCLPRNVGAIGLLHGVISVTMEDDDRHGLNGLLAQCDGLTRHAFKPRHAAAPAFYRGQG